jgi:type VI secretion system secreted protein VgrG
MFDEQIRALHSETGQPIAEMPYKMVTGDGEVFYGFTDQEGKTMRIGSAEPSTVKVYWGEMPPSEA